jgi:hypothetical protein
MSLQSKKLTETYKIWPHNCTKEAQYLTAEKITSITSYGREFVWYKVLKGQRLYSCEFTPNELRKVELLNV